MKGSKLVSVFLSLSVLTSQSLYANEASRMLVVPNCLVKSLTIPFTKLTSDKELSLIKVKQDQIPAVAAAKHQSKAVCGGFIDVTDEWQTNLKLHHAAQSKNTFLSSYHMKKTSDLPEVSAYVVSHPVEANKLMEASDKNRIWEDLTTLTNFKNRSATTSYGVETAAWIKTSIEGMAKAAGRNDISVRYVETPGYKQPSVVAKIGTSTEPGIVLGAHMDTISLFGSDRQPGADDDGSGSATVLEVARTLISSNIRFNKPIYVMWYAAEERGLVGSKYVVRDFKEKNIPVSAVLHLDMDGFPDSQNPSAIWLVEDYVNADLTNFLETLVKTYVKQPVERTACGYACSDHASWTRAGFKSCFPLESSFERSNQSIHSPRDTMEKLSLSHMADYAKLGLVFAAELADPIKG